MWNPACAAMHLGLWAAPPHYLRQALTLIKAGVWKPNHPPEARCAAANEALVTDSDGIPLYLRDAAGIAQINIGGPILKGRSKYGGTSSLDVRKALRLAANDPGVRGAFLVIDSPGGSVAGTQELRNDLANFGKPTAAYVEDSAASAAYWVASTANRVSMNRAGFVGSIGAYAVIEDTSKAAEMEGVQVHVISSGGIKGQGVDGAPISREFLDEVQAQVNHVHGLFVDDVANGRKLTTDAVSALADGRLYMAADAKAKGLVDEVESADAAYKALLDSIAPKRTASARAKVRIAQMRN